jgi:hypothetical protein
MLTYTYPQGGLFWMMVQIFLFAIWIWLLAALFGEVLRSHGMSGGAKALWAMCRIVLPVAGILRHLIACGKNMQQRSLVATVGS